VGPIKVSAQATGLAVGGQGAVPLGPHKPRGAPKLVLNTKSTSGGPHTTMQFSERGGEALLIAVTPPELTSTYTGITRTAALLTHPP
jgi:hypothetical protein